MYIILNVRYPFINLVQVSHFILVFGRRGSSVIALTLPTSALLSGSPPLSTYRCCLFRLPWEYPINIQLHLPVCKGTPACITVLPLITCIWFHDNSSTDISSTTLGLQTFRLLLYTRVQDSYTSNFCFSKSLFSSIPTSTYTMIPFINPISTDTMIIQHI